MSLDFDYTNVNFTDDMLTPDGDDVRHAVVFNMMFVGISHLNTRVECETFYNRYLQYAMAQGTKPSEVFLSYADVVMWKNITTNVSRMTDAAFAKKIRTLIELTSWESFKTARAEAGAY